MSDSSSTLSLTETCRIISANLKTLRLDRKLRQRDMADIMKMSFRSYQRIEADGFRLRAAHIEFLAHGLGYRTAGEMAQAILKRTP